MDLDYFDIYGELDEPDINEQFAKVQNDYFKLICQIYQLVTIAVAKGECSIKCPHKRFRIR